MKTNTQTITREFAEQNILFFYPKTQAEAFSIQEKLFELGFVWAKSGVKSLRNGQECVSRGLFLDCTGYDGSAPGIYTVSIDGSPKDAARGLLCTLDQFDEGGQVLREILAMRAEITSLRAKVDVLEGKVDDVHTAIMPTTINKGPVLKP